MTPKAHLQNEKEFISEVPENIFGAKIRCHCHEKYSDFHRAFQNLRLAL
jgi:hypothetical protein